MVYVLCVAIGLLAGVLGGMFGIGGGIVIVPCLVLLAGLAQHSAQGTSLVALSIPVLGLAAYNYWKDGNANIGYGLLIAAGILIGGYFGSRVSLGIDPIMMRKLFGGFIILVGTYLIFKR